MMTAVMVYIHQATKKFKHAATGSQCSSICTALIASKLKSASDWDSDFFLCHSSRGRQSPFECSPK